MAEDQDRDTEQIEEVKTFLKDGPKKTLVIAKRIMGKYATCKMVNPLLFRMKDEGIIRKVVQQPPEWGLMSQEPQK